MSGLKFFTIEMLNGAVLLFFFEILFTMFVKVVQHQIFSQNL